MGLPPESLILHSTNISSSVFLYSFLLYSSVRRVEQGEKKIAEKKESGCNPDTILSDHPHQHSLLCRHHAYFDEERKKVMYLHDGEFHENCDNGHTHRSQLCLKHEFTKVAGPEEDCSRRDDCHVHIREDGVAELHHPAEEESKDHKCQVIAKFRPLT